MSYCINPYCPKPFDPANVKNRICCNCGSDLVLKGRYRVLNELGSGGFGKTFEVDDCGTIKVLKVLTENSIYDSTITDINLLDCLASQDASSKECDKTRFIPIARNSAINYCQDINSRHFNGDCYLVYVCPSCVISHNDIISRKIILNAFIKWFLSLVDILRKPVFQN